MVCCNLPLSSPLNCLFLVWVPSYEKKTLFSLQGVGGKNGRQGRYIQVPSPLAQKKSLIFFARSQMLKCTHGNCILLAWPSSRTFPSSDIALRKILYFSWKVIKTKMYKRKFHFIPRVFTNFPPLQLQCCVETLSPKEKGLSTLQTHPKQLT